jgi:hypothetical protein
MRLCVQKDFVRSCKPNISCIPAPPSQSTSSAWYQSPFVVRPASRNSELPSVSTFFAFLPVFSGMQEYSAWLDTATTLQSWCSPGALYGHCTGLLCRYGTYFLQFGAVNCLNGKDVEAITMRIRGKTAFLGFRCVWGDVNGSDVSVAAFNGDARSHLIGKWKEHLCWFHY